MLNLVRDLTGFQKASKDEGISQEATLKWQLTASVPARPTVLARQAHNAANLEPGEPNLEFGPSPRPGVRERGMTAQQPPLRPHRVPGAAEGVATMGSDVG